MTNLDHENLSLPVGGAGASKQAMFAKFIRSSRRKLLDAKLTAALDAAPTSAAQPS